MAKGRWTFLTSHGVVFLYLVDHPQATIRRISDDLGLAERTVAGILADLKQDGYISVGKNGKFNIYTVYFDLPMRHPAQSHFTVGEFFAMLKREEETTVSRRGRRRSKATAR